VGRAQARYLWLLLVAGLFYLALDSQLSGPADGAGELVVPLVNLTLSAVPVWASGPAVLCILLLATHGSLRAYRTAAAAVGVEAFGLGEEHDGSPNALDFVVYTTSESPRWARGLLLFTYPLYLGLFCVEAWWLWLALYRRPGVPAKPLFVAVGGVLLLFATWRVLSYVLKNAGRAHRVLRGDKDV
jgi:hypothetical protein